VSSRAGDDCFELGSGAEEMTPPFPPPVIRHKLCSACGEPFDCCAGGCWCDDVLLTAQVRVDLRDRYADCLCPKCLSQAAEATVRHPS